MPDRDLAYELPGEREEYQRRRRRLSRYALIEMAILGSVVFAIGASPIHFIGMMVFFLVALIACVPILVSVHKSGFGGASITVDVPRAARDVLALCGAAVRGTAPTCFVVDEQRGSVAGLTPMSLWGVGERVTATIEEVLPESVVVLLTSETLLDQRRGSARKNAENVAELEQKIMQATAEEGQR